MSPRRILQVNAFYRETTGADRYVRDLSALLASRGHEIAHFCAAHPGDDETPWARYFPEGARTEPGAPFAAGRALRDAGKFLFHREARRRAADVARDFAPELVHAHNLFHHLSPSVLAPLRRGGVPVVMTLHDYKLVCPCYTLHTQGSPCTACLGGRFSNAVRRRCVRGSALKSALCAIENTIHSRLGLYAKNVDRFVAPSRFLRDRLLEAGFAEERLSVLPNFTPLPALPSSPEEDFVLFAGRLVAIKGPLTLLGAWRRTRARKSLRLVVAGDGPLAAEIARFVEDHRLVEVELAGALGREQLGRLMARALAVVVPSEWYEVCPLAVLEAQARGRCVVASRIGGIPELVEDGVTGILVPPGDEEGLAAAIDAAAEDPALRQRVGAAACSLVERRHSAEAHYTALSEIYAGAAAS